MKRNIFIVLLLVLLGGGFMYLNSNTDYFTGFTTFVPQQNETSTQFTSDIDTQILNVDPDAHLIDKLYHVRANILNSLKKEINKTDLNDEQRSLLIEQLSSTQELFNDTISQMLDIHNLTNFGEIQIKKVDGQYVPCEANEIGNLDECKGFKDFGYSDDNIRDILGLDKYVQNSITTESPTSAQSFKFDPDLMKELQNLDGATLIESDILQDEAVTNPENLFN